MSLYDSCINDIEIAKSELRRLKMYPENIIADFYFVPAHDHQTYYAAFSQTSKGLMLTYIKPLIYESALDVPVRMCSFSECKKAEAHSIKQGQFIAGLSSISRDYLDKLFKIAAQLQDSVIEESMTYIDSGIRLVRVNDNVKKIVMYSDANNIGKLTKEHIDYLNSIHYDLEKIIL